MSWVASVFAMSDIQIVPVIGTLRPSGRHVNEGWLACFQAAQWCCISSQAGCRPCNQPGNQSPEGAQKHPTERRGRTPSPTAQAIILQEAGDADLMQHYIFWG
jgi:hypothetical protein